MSTRQKIVSAFLVITVLNVAISITDAAPEVRYRGFTVVSMDQAVLEEAVNKWNANQVRYMICPDVWRMTEMKMPSVKATWDKLMADLPKGLDIAKSLGLAVVLDLHQLPIDNPKKYSSD